MPPFFCAKCGKQFDETAAACPHCGSPAEETRQIIAAAEPVVPPGGGPPVGWNFSGELRGKCPDCGSETAFRDLIGSEATAYMAKSAKEYGGLKRLLWAGLSQTLSGLFNSGKVGLQRKCTSCERTYLVCRSCMRLNKDDYFSPQDSTPYCRMCGAPVI